MVERLKRVKHRLVTTLLVVAALVLSGFAALSGTTPAKAAPSGPRWPIKGAEPRDSDNVILKWDEELLKTIRDNPGGTGPTVTARAIGILHTATYDAWTAYDPIAKATHANGNTKQPVNSDPAVDKAKKSKAISFAAYKTLVDLFPYREPFFGNLMNALGYTNFASDPSTEAAIGNRAADAVITFRHADGSNQTRDTKGTADPSDDTVSYPYVCTPTSTSVCYSAKNEWNLVNQPGHWQPLCVLTVAGVAAKAPPVRDPGEPCPDPDGYYAVQKPATPQWGTIKGFALNPETQMPPHFAVPGPPMAADGSYDPTEIDLALSDTSNLDDVKKAKAEYWADGPQSEFPPGHTMVFAQALSRMRGHTLDQDVKLFFMLGNAEMDASISAWKAKYDWDCVRVITAIRERYKGQMITSWKGPNLGYGKVLGQNWLPYQALNVVTPPFPEYVSGHSTFTAAGRTILGGFEGSDKFNAQVVIPAGSSRFEANTPATNITLTWKTLTAAADEAGWSRRWGGIHFKSGDEHGRLLGKVVASDVWDKAQTYFNGTATATT